MLFDRILLDSASMRITRDGYLVARPPVARTGIQIYAGSEVGRPNDSMVRLFRPESEVFSQETLASFAHRPMTNDHPPEAVTAANWRKYATGSTGPEVTRDGDTVVVPLVLMDAEAIKDVQDGKRELSWGYDCAFDWTPGTTESGEAYDGIQRNIRGNHLAVVDRGRAGPEFRILDHKSPTERPPAMNLRPITIDGLTIQVTDQGAEAITKLQAQLADSAKKAEGLAGQIAGLKVTHDAAIEAKDGEIAGLKAKVLDTAALDAAVTARSALIVSARKLLGDAFDPTGKGDNEIRRLAAAKRLGDAALVGKSDEYVTAAFDALVHTSGTGPARDPVSDALGLPPVNDLAPAPGGFSKDSYEARMAARVLDRSVN